MTSDNLVASANVCKECLDEQLKGDESLEGLLARREDPGYFPKGTRRDKAALLGFARSPEEMNEGDEGPVRDPAHVG